MSTMIEVQNLKKYFKVPSGELHAVDDVSFRIERGKTMGIVGESGCGKSTLGRTMIHLTESTGGKILFEDKDVTRLTSSELKRYRHEVSIIFQDPYSSLNPRMTAEQTIAEALKITGRYSKNKIEGEIKRIFELVGLDRRFLKAYPHELDGGRRQRVGIGRALALNPKFIVCDEPVSALDVSIQSQVLNLLKDLQEQRKLTYLFISHDLSVVKFISGRVCVMFLGTVCEIGKTEALYEKPLHPYTRFLLDAIPQADPRLRSRKKEILTGEIPSPVDPPSGCRFRTRCPRAKEICSRQQPSCRQIEDRQVFCHFPLD